MADFTHIRLGRYELMERIGAGGMARVYKGWDTNLERTVAIKVLHEHLADDPSFKERFEREAKLVASLNHPNIVQVYDFDATERDGFPLYYMVMSYIPGKTLRQVQAELAAQDELMSYDRVLSIMLNLAEALSYAHEAGMVHRDVKPANVMLNQLDQAILTDFGIARLVASSRLTQDGTSTGTPAYMSPEQARGLSGDMRSDLYSLGVILYELLTGVTPYQDDNGLSLMLKHINNPIPRLSLAMQAATPLLDELIFRSLAKEPEDRYQNAREFIADLKRAFIGQFVDSTPEMAVVALPRRTGETPRALTTNNGQTLIQPTAPLPTQQLAPAAQPRRLLFFGVVAGILVTLLIVITASTFFLSGGSDSPTESQAAVGEIIPGASESMTGSVYFTSTFEADDEYASFWPQGSMGGFSQAITPDGQYRLRSERTRTASTSIFSPDYTYGSVSIAMTGLLEEESNPAAAYGIVFRYQDQDHYNVFAVDGMGRYSIWARTSGQWVELRAAEENWTPNENVNPRGTANRLLVDILGDHITGYVNGVEVFDLDDDTFDSGSLGIYIATHTDGIASVVIDDYQTFPAAPPSMTGG